MKKEREKEIKYLLEEIEDNTQDYVGTNGCLYQDLEREELNLILDCISNLQNQVKKQKEVIDNAITNINILIEIIKQQPTDNALDDLWILDKLNGFKNILKEVK